MKDNRVQMKVENRKYKSETQETRASRGLGVVRGFAFVSWVSKKQSEVMDY